MPQRALRRSSGKIKLVAGAPNVSDRIVNAGLLQVGDNGGRAARRPRTSRARTSGLSDQTEHVVGAVGVLTKRMHALVASRRRAFAYRRSARRAPSPTASMRARCNQSGCPRPRYMADRPAPGGAASGAGCGVARGRVPFRLDELISSNGGGEHRHAPGCGPRLRCPLECATSRRCSPPPFDACELQSCPSKRGSPYGVALGWSALRTRF